MIVGNIRIIYDNFAEAGIVSGGSWLTGMPLTNMFDQALGLVARSTNATTGSTQFKIDLGIVPVVGGVAVGPTNLSPGAQYRVTSYFDAGFSVLAYDSGTKFIQGTTVDSLDLEWENPDFWYGIDPTLQLAPWIIEIVPDDQVGVTSAAQYWKVEMIDPENADGFVEVGYCIIGRTFRPSLNYDENNSFTRIELTDTIEALGGHRDYWHRGSRRSLKVTWWRLDEPEGWGDVYRMMTTLGTHQPMFVVPDPDDDENLQKRSFLATFANSPELRLIIQDGVTTGFDLEEVL